MNPAFSVIFLTTLIGAAQGLFLALFGVQLAGLASPEFLAAGGVVALALTVAGLVSSFFTWVGPSAPGAPRPCGAPRGSAGR